MSDLIVPALVIAVVASVILGYLAYTAPTCQCGQRDCGGGCFGPKGKNDGR